MLCLMYWPCSRFGWPLVLSYLVPRSICIILRSSSKETFEPSLRVLARVLARSTRDLATHDPELFSKECLGTLYLSTDVPKQVPGKLVATFYGLLWGTALCHFRPLGFEGTLRKGSSLQGVMVVWGTAAYEQPFRILRWIHAGPVWCFVFRVWAFEISVQS